MDHQYERIVVPIRLWFDKNEYGGLVLPSGWFGRPYDNRFVLKDINIEAGNLILRLGGDYKMIISGEIAVNDINSELTISGYDRCEFQWVDQGTGEINHEVFTNDNVKFVPFPG